MGIETIGQVTIEATIENLEDIWAVERGLTPDDQARSLIVPQAVVDPEAIFVSLPSRMMSQLGLSRSGLIRLTIQGRSCRMEVKEVPEDVPPKIGRLTLMHLDWVVDSIHLTLIGNPTHGGEWMYELY